MPNHKVEFGQTQLWRWHYGAGYRAVVAQQIAKRRLVQSTDDEWIRAAVKYFQAPSGSSIGRSHISPHRVGDAVRIQSCADLQAPLMVLVLGNTPRSRITELLDLDEPAIEAWERLFFACREYLSARGLVANKTIFPYERNGDLDLAAKMRMALACGPAVAEALVTTDEELSDELHSRLVMIKAALRITEAWNMAITSPRAAVAAMRLYVQMLERDGETSQRKTNVATAAEARAREFELDQLAATREKSEEQPTPPAPAAQRKEASTAAQILPIRSKRRVPASSSRPAA